MTLETIKDISIIFAGAIGLITFATGVLQYMRQGHQVRATQFVEMRRRFLEDPIFRNILNRLATDDPSLSEVPIQDRRNLVGFLEELALMTNSNLIRPKVAHYMFGYYVVLIDNSQHFWTGLDKSSVYWRVFHDFAKAMREMEKDRQPDVRELVF